MVDGVSLRVEAGEIVALLGPNGAGKTTTVEIVEGYRRADAGSAAGPRPGPGRAAGATLRARVGLMLQGGGIDMRARPRETLRQYAAFHADPRDPDELLDLVGLRDGGRPPATGACPAVSGSGSASPWPSSVGPRWSSSTSRPPGWTRRAGPRPVGSSPTCARPGVAILLTSHDLADVERLADRIDVLVDGRIVAAGTPAELAAGLRPRLRLRFERPLTPAQEDAPGARRAPDRRQRRGRGGLVRDRRRPADPVADGGDRGVGRRGRAAVVESRSVGGSLEDAYLALVGAA